MNIKRCMGTKRMEGRCDECKWLPRTPEDEEAEDWIEPSELPWPCPMFRQMKGAANGRKD